MPLTIDAQVAELRRWYPSLRVVFQDWWGACWQGPIKSLDQTYEIRITYILASELGGCEVLNWIPEVVVLDPPLRRFTDEFIPHVFEADPLPILCLFDKAAEWNAGTSIARTIIPWTSEWLTFYELWRATGVWSGYGRHPNAQERLRLPADLVQAAAQTAPAGAPTPAPDHAALGMETEASLPILDAAISGKVEILRRRRWHRLYRRHGLAGLAAAPASASDLRDAA